MSRFLFVVPPLAGHVNPTIAVGRELAGRGHDVAWAGPPGETEHLLPDGSTVFPAGPRGLDVVTSLQERPRGLRHAGALKFLWEEVLIPLGHAMVDGVDTLIDTWQPDVLVSDQQALAGAAVARKRGLRWATSATTPAELMSPLGIVPLVNQWVRDQLARFQVAVGVPDVLGSLGDLRFSEHLVLIFTTPELIDPHHHFPPHYAFVGPSLTDRPEPHPFPWDWLDPTLPHILVSLGTVNHHSGEEFFRVAAEALAGEPLQAILVAPPDRLGPHASAGNLLARERVPQLSLLPHMNAVVSHGGANASYETLAHGLPLVLAPIRDDQPVVSDGVVGVGAGVRVRFTRARPSEIRTAVRTVLDQPSFRRAAGAIQQSFQAAGGAAAAATRLEELARRSGAIYSSSTGTGLHPGEAGMSPARFLFVVPPLAGHVNPTISVGRELARRGHDVAWAAPPGETERLLPPDARVFTAGPAWMAEAADAMHLPFGRLRHAAALKFLWEEVLIPLAHAMTGDVDTLVDSWQPDVLIADQQALAGAAIARKRGLPWATSATTPAEVINSLSALPLVDQWVRDQIAELQSTVGIPDPVAAQGDLRFSEHLVLVFTTPELVDPHRQFPSHYAFVGPSITDRPEPHPFPWDWLDPTLPHVLVSLGTFSLRGGERFFTTVIEALAGEPLQAILVAPPDLLGRHAPAGNLLARTRVPQLDLLPFLDAVVSHGGANAVYETLAHGVPLVLAPVVNDGPVVADQVARTGAGIRVRFTRARPSEIRTAVRTVLDQPSFRRAAGAIQQSFQAAGGAAAAADRLEALLNQEKGRGPGLMTPARNAG